MLGVRDTMGMTVLRHARVVVCSHTGMVMRRRDRADRRIDACVAVHAGRGHRPLEREDQRNQEQHQRSGFAHCDSQRITPAGLLIETDD